MGLLLLPVISGLLTGLSLSIVTCFAVIIAQIFNKRPLRWLFHVAAASYLVYAVISSEELLRADFFIVSYAGGAVFSYVVMYALAAHSLTDNGKAKSRNTLIWIIILTLGFMTVQSFWGIFQSVDLDYISARNFFGLSIYFVIAALLAYCTWAIYGNRKSGLYVLAILTGFSLIHQLYFAFTFDNKWFDPVQHLIGVAAISIFPLFAISYLYSRIEHME